VKELGAYVLGTGLKATLKGALNAATVLEVVSGSANGVRGSGAPVDGLGGVLHVIPALRGEVLGVMNDSGEETHCLFSLSGAQRGLNLRVLVTHRVEYGVDC